MLPGAVPGLVHGMNMFEYVVDMMHHVIKLHAILHDQNVPAGTSYGLLLATRYTTRGVW